MKKEVIGIKINTTNNEKNLEKTYKSIINKYKDRVEIVRELSYFLITVYTEPDDEDLYDIIEIKLGKLKEKPNEFENLVDFIFNNLFVDKKDFLEKYKTI